MGISEKIWRFSNCESIRKIEKNLKRYLSKVVDNFERYYILPQKSGNLTMEMKQLKLKYSAQSIIFIKTIRINLNQNYILWYDQMTSWLNTIILLHMVQKV